MLQALVEEMNRYGEDPEEALRLLNIKPEASEPEEFTVHILRPDGKPVDVERLDRLCVEHRRLDQTSDVSSQEVISDGLLQRRAGGIDGQHRCGAHRRSEDSLPWNFSYRGNREMRLLMRLDDQNDHVNDVNRFDDASRSAENSRP